MSEGWRVMTHEVLLEDVDAAIHNGILRVEVHNDSVLLVNEIDEAIKIGKIPQAKKDCA